MALGGRHSLPGFEKSLDELRESIHLMAALVRRSMSNAKTGFAQRDEDCCLAVIADDEEVDLIEKQVDRVRDRHSDAFCAAGFGLPYRAGDDQTGFTFGEYL